MSLLRSVPDEALGDVLCCFRDPYKGNSRIMRMADLDRFPELSALGSLGQLMTGRVIERFLKDDSTDKERRQAALSWLDKLEAGQVSS